MNLRFISYDFKANIKAWLRSPGTVFWTVLFPVLLIMIFGAIFSGVGEVNYDLVVQNMDDREDYPVDFSQIFIDSLEESGVFTIIEIDNDADISEYLRDNDKPVGLVIPEAFTETLLAYSAHIEDDSIPFDYDLPFNLTIYSDPSDQTTTPVIRSILTGFLYQYNINLSQGEIVLGFDEKSALAEDFEFIDYFLPGMIGFTIMTSCIYGSIERNTKYRQDGILRKLLTMPVTRADWILSKMLFMLFLSFISTLVILLVGILMWGLSVKLNLFSFIIIIASSFMFTGMGMIIGRFVKDPEIADMAGGAITFPMMFLAGTFFPLEQMPAALQSIAQVLPLYYVNEGLRNAMIYADFDKTLYFTGFVLVFAAIFFIVGVLLTKWKED